ncbi:dTMP kinase [Desulfonatronovibrio hydrogenovorans]|uniref:dTMP kinase n=1 Tax=Desulfonatronovibrio hydrogenovorans TaxID=53245 RepID=UPI00048D034F|nr:dTMP kinase [Desulfonatronovibrio hydrogenovorans]
MFITFEGIEGCGKSTQCRRLKSWLEEKGSQVVLTLEPGGSRLGLDLRRILLSMDNTDLSMEAELFLYLADRSQHVHTVIRPALEAGSTVISDRFADSTIVYQGYARGMDPGTLDHLNQIATTGIWPDLTVLLDLPAEIGLKRALDRNIQQNLTRSEGRFEAESLDFHNRVRQGYLAWAGRNPDRFLIVDATGSVEDIFETIRSRLESDFLKKS